MTLGDKKLRTLSIHNYLLTWPIEIEANINRRNDQWWLSLSSNFIINMFWATWMKVQNLQNPELVKIKSLNLQYAYKYQLFQV